MPSVHSACVLSQMTAKVSPPVTSMLVVHKGLLTIENTKGHGDRLEAVVRLSAST